MNFTSLTGAKTTSGSIKRWVNYAELDSEQVLDEAQTFLYETLRVREMRAEFSDLSLAVGDSSKALPSGFLDPIALIDKTNSWRLMLKAEAWLMGRRQYEDAVLVSDLPRYFAIFDEKLQFECKYESAATLSLIGYKMPDLLASSSNETNFLTTRYPHLLRRVCVAQAHSFMNNDERAERELAAVSAMIQDINAKDELSYRGLTADVELV